MDLTNPIGNDPSFHKEIRALRLQLGYDHAGFAEALGVSLSSVINWEKPYDPPYSSRPNTSSRAAIKALIDAQPDPTFMPPVNTPVTAPAPNGTFSLVHMSVTVSADNLAAMSPADHESLLKITNQVIRTNAQSMAKAYEIQAQLEALLRKS